MSKPVKVYDYLDPSGKLLYQNCRYEPKDFRLRRSDGNGGYKWNLQGVERTLYRLPQLLESSTQDFVFLVEGEKDVDNLTALGFISTTPGSNTAWKSEFAKHFKGRLVAVVPDNDPAGKLFAEMIVKSLHGVAVEIRVLNLPGLNDKEDISDWLDAGGDVPMLMEVVDNTKPYKPPAAIQPVIVNLATITPKRINWLWPDRVPMGGISLLVGNPGEGKSTLTMDMASRVTAGQPWPDKPDENRAPGGVVLLSAEDNLADVVVPRLQAAEADLSRVVAIRAVKESDGDGKLSIDAPFDIARHMEALQATIDVQGNTQLVIVDPVSAFMGKADSHKNAETRNVLARLAKLAELNNIAIICVTHLNKTQGQNASQRIIGSIAFNAAARAVWHVARCPDDAERRLLLPGKCNLARQPDGLAFTLVGTRDGDITSVKVEFETEAVYMNIDEVLAPPRRNSDGQAVTKVDDAMRWLKEKLESGERLSSTLIDEGENEDFSRDILFKAKKRLGVQARKAGFGTSGKWYWRLSTDDED